MGNARESDAAVGWREIVRGHADSGLSVAAYCRRMRVSVSSFYAWRRKLRAAATPAEAGAQATFAEVRVAAPARGPSPAAAVEVPDGAFEVRLPGGCGIVVRPGFDRQTLLDLVTTLEADV